MGVWVWVDFTRRCSTVQNDLIATERLEFSSKTSRNGNYSDLMIAI